MKQDREGVFVAGTRKKEEQEKEGVVKIWEKSTNEREIRLKKGG